MSESDAPPRSNQAAQPFTLYIWWLVAVRTPPRTHVESEAQRVNAVKERDLCIAWTRAPDSAETPNRRSFIATRYRIHRFYATSEDQRHVYSVYRRCAALNQGDEPTRPRPDKSDLSGNLDERQMGPCCADLDLPHRCVGGRRKLTPSIGKAFSTHSTPPTDALQRETSAAIVAPPPSCQSHRNSPPVFAEGVLIKIILKGRNSERRPLWTDGDPIKMAAEQARSEAEGDVLPWTVAEFYRGQSVLLTGGSGFVGRVLLEKLLFYCPDIDTVYVLLRPRKGLSVQERLHKLLDVPLFDRVRVQRPEALGRLQAVEGDTAQPGLALAEADARVLAERVSVVFHLAASVRFDDPLIKAVRTNACATRDLLELAMRMPKLKREFEEKLYPAAGDWRSILALVEAQGQSDPVALRALTTKILGPHCNTYTFTKNLAEHIVDHYSDRLPVGIVRPSGDMHRITQGHLNEIAHEACAEMPFSNTLYHPCCNLTRNRLLFLVQFFFFHLVPAVIVDALLSAAGRKPMLIRLQRRIYSANMAISFFVLQDWDFLNDRFMDLEKRIQPEDREGFGYRFEKIVPEEFLRNGLRGTRRYLMKEPDSNLPQAIRAYKRWAGAGGSEAEGDVLAVDVAEFYRGQSVLLTGGSGFVGRCCWETAPVLLPRHHTSTCCCAPQGVAVQERAAQAARRPSKCSASSSAGWFRLADARCVGVAQLFDRVRAQRPEALGRLQAVEGDTAQPGLALAEADARVLAERVSVVFHLAASVRFDDPLITAVRTNAILGPHCNTYTFTKNLAEHIVDHYSARLPVGISRLIDMAYEASAELPFSDTLYHPCGSLTTNRLLFLVQFFFFHLLLALIGDALLFATGRKPMLIRLQRRIYSANMALSFFVLQSWDFLNNRFMDLEKRIQPEDREGFSYQLDNLVPEAFFRDALRGTRRYLMKEPDSNLPQAIRAYKRHCFMPRLSGLFYQRSTFCCLRNDVGASNKENQIHHQANI
ncbi:Fatty acyl-CoA reductase [Gryllus bimaculatus]|nr:Fatty acyl-CoA reductase [Gryllus bimaculatus]